MKKIPEKEIIAMDNFFEELKQLLSRHRFESKEFLPLKEEYPWVRSSIGLKKGDCFIHFDITVRRLDDDFIAEVLSDKFQIINDKRILRAYGYELED
ncbi:MAG: hypothetical protein QNJ41_18260 [Xenococcaceae cyanobacterium MO_188.B32]|nr:hypothetical protein [Xenococcaceae cyanobacterium MO_188.B32]